MYPEHDIDQYVSNHNIVPLFLIENNLYDKLKLKYNNIEDYHDERDKIYKL